MGKYNLYQSDSGQLGKCSVCMEYIAVEYYIAKGETIVCHECGTEYILTNRNPATISITGVIWNPSDFYGTTSLDK